LASAVFSLVLLVSIAGFLEIGRLFYKGVSTTQTQSITKQLADQLSSEVQAADTILGPINSGTGYSYYCIGGSRYTVNIGNEVDFSQPRSANPPPPVSNGNFGIIRDTLPGNSGCAAPCNTGCPTPFQSSTTELLGNKMRVMDLKVQPLPNPNGKLYTISIKVAYGDDDVLDNPTDPNTIDCKGNLSNQQFCSVDSVSTSIYKGFGS
jgi:hypothetical protein